MAKGVGKQNRKLHYIKSCIEEWDSAHNSYRKYEVKLSRLWYIDIWRLEMTSNQHEQMQLMEIRDDNQTLPSGMPQ